MYVSEAEQVQARLKIQRKVLDDFDDAIKMTKQLMVDQSSYTAEIPKLKEEIDLLVAEKKQLQDDVVEAKRIHGETMRRQTEVAEKNRQELNTKKHLLESKITELENNHKVRMSELDATYRVQLEKLKKETADEEKRLETIKGGIAAAKAAMAKL